MSVGASPLVFPDVHSWHAVKKHWTYNRSVQCFPPLKTNCCYLTWVVILCCTCVSYASVMQTNFYCFHCMSRLSFCSCHSLQEELLLCISKRSSTKEDKWYVASCITWCRFYALSLASLFLNTCLKATKYLFYYHQQLGKHYFSVCLPTAWLNYHSVSVGLSTSL